MHAAAVAVVLWGSVPVASATTDSGSASPGADGRTAADKGGERRPRKVLSYGRWPGESFRKRPALVQNATVALTLLLRTEDQRDAVYVAARRKVSDDVAGRMGLDPDALHDAWSRSPRDHQIAVLAAMTQMGVRYLEGREEPYVQMDCSGLLWFAWRTAGVDMPRQAVSQLDKRMRIDPSDAVAGDVVGYGTHVHIYLGVGHAMIHAPFSGREVKLKHMPPEQVAVSAWANPSNIATFRL